MTIKNGDGGQVFPNDSGPEHYYGISLRELYTGLIVHALQSQHQRRLDEDDIEYAVDCAERLIDKLGTTNAI